MILSFLLINTILLIFCVIYLFKFKSHEINNLNTKLQQLEEQLNQIDKIQVENEKLVTAVENQKEVIQNLNVQIKGFINQVESSTKESIEKQSDLNDKTKLIYEDLNVQIRSFINQIENSAKESIEKQSVLISKTKLIYEDLNEKLNSQKANLDENNILVKKLSNQLENTFEENSSVWDETIERAENEEDKLRLLKAAFYRFPKKRIYVDQIRAILEPKCISNKNLLIRREAIVILENVFNQFINHCKNEDFKYAKDFKESIQYANEVLLEEIDNLHQSNIEEQLSLMKKYLNEFDAIKNSSVAEKHLLKIEKADQSINQKTLKRFPELQKEYKAISKQIIDILRKDKDQRNQKELIDENNKAIENAKEVLALFDDEGFLTKILNRTKFDNQELKKLVRLLNPEKPELLIPSTIQYIKLAENTLFSKLNSKEKESFTRLMVNETYKS